jgi:hypothetical protein
MVSVVVFGAAFMCIIFFALGLIFKVLASAVNALMDSGTILVAAIIIGILSEVALYMLSFIIHGVVTAGWMSVIFWIVMMIVFFGVIIAIALELGMLALEFALVAVEYIFVYTSRIFEICADYCGRAYAHFLSVIIGRLDRM